MDIGMWYYTERGLTDLITAGGGNQSSGLTVADISRATSNFSEKNMVKQGASSSIYKGKLKDGSEIAVKRARKVCRKENIMIKYLLALVHRLSY
jgi:hypothetical protein